MLCSLNKQHFLYYVLYQKISSSYQTTHNIIFLIFPAIRTHSPNKPVLVFVSSRRQTRLTALDLIAFLAAEDNPKQWLHMHEMEVSTLYR